MGQYIGADGKLRDDGQGQYSAYAPGYGPNGQVPANAPPQNLPGGSGADLAAPPMTAHASIGGVHIPGTATNPGDPNFVGPVQPGAGSNAGFLPYLAPLLPSILGGFMSTGAIDEATKALTEGGNKAITTVQGGADKAAGTLSDVYGQQKQALSPYTTAGAEAETQLGNRVGPGGDLVAPYTGNPNFSWTPADLANDPGYKFRLEQGQKAIEASGAAKGKRFSGATMKALADYAGESASQEAQAAWTRDNTTFNENYGRDSNQFYTNQKTQRDALQALAASGQAAAGTEVNAAGQYGTNLSNLQSGTAKSIADIQTQIASATASGDIAKANMLQATLTALTQGMTQAEILAAMKNPPAGPGTTINNYPSATGGAGGAATATSGTGAGLRIPPLPPPPNIPLPTGPALPIPTPPIAGPGTPPGDVGVTIGAPTDTGVAPGATPGIVGPPIPGYPPNPVNMPVGDSLPPGYGQPTESVNIPDAAGNDPSEFPAVVAAGAAGAGATAAGLAGGATAGAEAASAAAGTSAGVAAGTIPGTAMTLPADVAAAIPAGSAGFASQAVSFLTNPITLGIGAGILATYAIIKGSQGHPTADAWVQKVQNPFDKSMGGEFQSALGAMRSGQMSQDDAIKTVLASMDQFHQYQNSLSGFAAQGDKQNTVATQATDTFNQQYGKNGSKSLDTLAAEIANQYGPEGADALRAAVNQQFGDVWTWEPYSSAA